MKRSSRALVLVVATAAATTAAARWLLRHQAALARRRIGKPHGEDVPDADRTWRRSMPGEPIDLLVLGDSIAAGLGAARRKETPGARLAKKIGARAQRPVRLRTGAVVGAESADLAAQLEALPSDYRADVVVIVVGGNDVTHRVPPAVAATHLAAAVTELRRAGSAVVVGSCPDLRALRAVPQPLRSLASRLSRQLAGAQERAARDAGATVVGLGRLLGPVFLAEPAEMFSLDRFHPSALGYRRLAGALLPATLRALDDPLPSAQTEALLNA